MAKKQIILFVSFLMVLGSTFPAHATTKYAEYTNPDYYFSFKYPASWTLHEPDDGTLTNQTDYFQKSASGLATSRVVASVAIPEEKYKNTNFIQAYATFAVNQDIGSLEVCKNYSHPSGETKKLTQKKVINGITYYVATITGAAAGTESKVRIYHTFYNDLCYEINFNVFTGSIVNYPEGTKAVNKTKIFKKLQRIFKTLTFTEETLTYLNPDLGITFQYPKSWGEIKGNQSNEMYSLNLPVYEGIPFYVGNNPDIEVPGRGGVWGDQGKAIKSEKDVQNYCNDKDTCRVYQNKSAVPVTIAKYANSLCFSEDCGEEFNHIEYYFYNPYSPFSGTVLSTYDFKPKSDQALWNLEKQFDQLVDSIAFVK